jgi:hypothetical protein
MKIHIGTVSHGTLRTEDLLEAFADELESVLDNNPELDDLKYRAMVAEARVIDVERMEENDDTDASVLVNELQDALDSLAPLYMYFGSTEGDDSDFGWWPNLDSLGEAIQDGEVLQLDAGDEIPTDYVGEVVFVNDHGNMAFGYVGEKSREFVEVWSCV